MDKNRLKILIVDDEESIRFALSELFSDLGFNVKEVESGEDAISLLEDEVFDIAIIDYQLHGMNGIELLKKIKSKYSNVQVLLITAFGSEDIAITAIKNGAYDYIAKPFKNEELINRINHIKSSIQNQISQKNNEEGFYFSGVMNNILDKIKTAAITDVPLLITGESGTGKELLAKRCHKHSNRKGKFVSINCSALPAALIESELFGAEKGSYTGAFKTKIGLFEIANNGTLFLDEIGDMPFELQSKLLRVLQEEEILRVGGNDSVKINARIIAATNKNIEEEVNNKKFREDLYYRLNVIRIRIPSLKLRSEEIKPISLMFLDEFNLKYNKNIIGFSEEALSAIQNYNWPGNIRELKNKIEQAVILTNSQWIEKNELSIENNLIKSNIIKENIKEIPEKKELKQEDKFVIESVFNDLPKTLIDAKKIISRDFERKYIKYYLKQNNWNVSKTAKVIGLYRQDLYKKIKELNIDKEN